YNWTGLDKKAAGKVIDYTVAEEAVAEYTTVITKATDGSFSYTVTNSHTTEEVDVSVEKVWNDANNQDGQRPADVTVHLLADGKDTGKSVTLSQENNWRYNWTGLDKKAAGKVIDYTVTEDAVTGYTASVNPDASDPLSITVTNSHTPEVTEATVVKVWDDKDNQDGIRPDKVTVTLMNGSKEVTDVVLEASSGWTATVSDIPKYENGVEIEYTWSEKAVPSGYTLSSSDKNGTVTTLTNTHAVETTTVSVTKVWDDADNQDGKRPTSVTVKLQADGKETGKSVTLSQENNWSYSWTKLDKNAAGQAIDYTVTENSVNDYTTTITKADDGSFTYTVKNSHKTATTEATVKKVWDDTDNQDGIRPATLTVKLLADGKETGRSVTLSESNTWSDTISGLDMYANGKEIAYTWQETGLPTGYSLLSTSKNGTVTTLTNWHKTETTEATVVKVWSDSNNQDNKRPAELVVKLLADGKDTGKTVTLNAGNSWEGTLTGLAKNAGGKAIEYTWEEVNLTDGYTLTDTSVNGTVTTLTNTYKAQETKLTVKKVWEDADNQDGIRPASLTVKLLADGTETGKSVTLNAGNSWEASIENLPVNNNGKAIVYTWVEDGLPTGYTLTSTSVNGTVTTLTNTHVTETTEATVKKTWSDSNNQDNKRPAEL
ncbi:MAG: Cna B-type domain-containing protein, partial [Prevotella sp.]|nr:Cna B-type domain-containing protein [Prevotella sp.]